jgi:hypothetical protein
MISGSGVRSVALVKSVFQAGELCGRRKDRLSGSAKVSADTIV